MNRIMMRTSVIAIAASLFLVTVLTKKQNFENSSEQVKLEKMELRIANEGNHSLELAYKMFGNIAEDRRILDSEVSEKQLNSYVKEYPLFNSYIVMSSENELITSSSIEKDGSKALGSGIPSKNVLSSISQGQLIKSDRTIFIDSNLGFYLAKAIRLEDTDINFFLIGYMDKEEFLLKMMTKNPSFNIEFVKSGDNILPYLLKVRAKKERVNSIGKILIAPVLCFSFIMFFGMLLSVWRMKEHGELLVHIDSSDELDETKKIIEKRFSLVLEKTEIIANLAYDKNKELRSEYLQTKRFKESFERLSQAKRALDSELLDFELKETRGELINSNMDEMRKIQSKIDQLDLNFSNFSKAVHSFSSYEHNKSKEKLMQFQQAGKDLGTEVLKLESEINNRFEKNIS